MAQPSENKTVQSRILKYAQDIGWTSVSFSDAVRRRSFSDGDDTDEGNRHACSQRAINLSYIKSISKNTGALYDSLH